jgi:dimethylglycine dehydrogenase
MDSLRIDKGYRGWKSDLESGYSPLESSLERFVDFTKRDFLGKEALVAQKTRGVERRLVPLTLDEPGDADPPYCSSIFSGENRVGLVTSGVWSHTLDRAVVLAYVKSAFAIEGTQLQVDVLGERRPATVGREPLFDPENLRPRS